VAPGAEALQAVLAGAEALQAALACAEALQAVLAGHAWQLLLAGQQEWLGDAVYEGCTLLNGCLVCWAEDAPLDMPLLAFLMHPMQHGEVVWSPVV